MEEVEFFSWDLSATRTFSEDELEKLRNLSPEDLAEGLWPIGGGPQVAAIGELVMHGLGRKAAQVSRALVASHPDCRTTFIEAFGSGWTNQLLSTPLERLRDIDT